MSNNIVILNTQHTKEIKELQAEFTEKGIRTVSVPIGIEIIQLPFESGETGIPNVITGNNLVIIQVQDARKDIQENAELVKAELATHDVDSIILPMDVDSQVIRA